MTPADPCPHVLPCGACLDCCERDHDHDHASVIPGITAGHPPEEGN
jgi:hypothetical protein